MARSGLIFQRFALKAGSGGRNPTAAANGGSGSGDGDEGSSGSSGSGNSGGSGSGGSRRGGGGGGGDKGGDLDLDLGLRGVSLAYLQVPHLPDIPSLSTGTSQATLDKTTSILSIYHQSTLLLPTQYLFNYLII